MKAYPQADESSGATVCNCKIQVQHSASLCTATGGAGFFVRSSAMPNDKFQRKKGAEPVLAFLVAIEVD